MSITVLEGNELQGIEDCGRDMGDRFANIHLRFYLLKIFYARKKKTQDLIKMAQASDSLYESHNSIAVQKTFFCSTFTFLFLRFSQESVNHHRAGRSPWSFVINSTLNWWLHTLFLYMMM